MFPFDKYLVRLKPYDEDNESDLVLSTVTDPASIPVSEKVSLSLDLFSTTVSDNVNEQAQNIESASPQLRAEIRNDEPTNKKNKLWTRQLWAFIEVPAFVMKDQMWL